MVVGAGGGGGGPGIPVSVACLGHPSGGWGRRPAVSGGEGFNFCFSGASSSVGGALFLAGGLRAGLLFYWVLTVFCYFLVS